MNSIITPVVEPVQGAALMRPDFSSRAKKVIGQYIKSAVLIDDDWPTYETRKEILDSMPLEAESELDLPDSDDISAEAIPLVASFPAVTSTPNRGMDDAIRLLKIQDCFTREGIICTGFKYTEKEKERAPKLAKNADILILDWNFAGDGGAGAVGILKELKDDQLRFVCIFTDQNDLLAIKNIIFKDVCEENSPDSNSLDFKAKNFVFTLRNKAVPDADLENESLEEDLLNDAVTHLANHYCGFLQLGMLEMISRHRSNLLGHLLRFSPDFDAALLSEASMEHSPVDMASNLRALLVDEWRIALESSAQQREMSILGKEGSQAYAASLKAKSAKVSGELFSACASALGITFDQADTKRYFTASEGQALRKFDIEVAKWLDDGAMTRVPGPRNIKDKEASKIAVATLYAICNSDAQYNDSAALAENIYKYVFSLDALFNQQVLLPKELTQGTILKWDEENYLICITPLCDTARLEDRHYSYSFLGATRAKSKNMLDRKNDYCVFMENGEPICLHVDIKRPYVYEVGPHERAIALTKKVVMRPRLLRTRGKLLAQGVPEHLTVSQTHDNNVVPINKDNGVDHLASPNVVENAAVSDVLGASEEEFSVEVVGQLRTDFFLMLTAASAGNASRVGVNRMEFIRFHKVSN